MSLTVHQLGKAALRRIGVLSYDPAQNATNQNRRGLCTGDLDEVLIAINGGAQECFALGPIELSEQQQSTVLRPGTGLTLDATQYSTTIANLTTWASWMQGCTVRISGDGQDNELISATQLLRPFMGVTGTGLVATVYGDAVALDSASMTVIEPVEIPQWGPLTPSTRPFQYWVGSRQNSDGLLLNGSLQSKPTGRPCEWTVETRNIATNAFTQRILRVFPMPDSAYSLSFRVQVKPPVYSQSDLYAGTSYGVDPGTIIPFDWVESTLLPEVLRRFSTHPAFDGDVEKIRLEAETAKRIFAESAKPQKVAQKAVYQWRV